MSIIARSTKMKALWVRCECPNKTERTETKYRPRYIRPRHWLDQLAGWTVTEWPEHGWPLDSEPRWRVVVVVVSVVDQRTRPCLGSGQVSGTVVCPERRLSPRCHPVRGSGSRKCWIFSQPSRGAFNELQTNSVVEETANGWLTTERPYSLSNVRVIIRTQLINQSIN